MKKTVTAFCVIFVALGLAFYPRTTPNHRAYGDATTDEAQFWGLLNAERAHHGVPPIPRDSRVDVIARNWAAHMAGQGQISHNPNLPSQLPPGWKKGGENVGRGGSVIQIHQAFVDSPEHEANLVDASWTEVGIGVSYGGDGSIYVTEDFAQYPPPPAPVPVPHPPVTAAPVRPPAPAPKPPTPTGCHG